MERGIIFSIEEFSIHDGPGIRTTIFLKGCPLRCVWCHNPEGISPYPQYLQKKDGKHLCGIEMTTDNLVASILKNKEVYTLNKGGVTLTGGEPLMQGNFVIELLQSLPGIHKAIETSGYAPAPVFKEVISHVDLVLLDIKHVDSVTHKKYTGRGNELILQNLWHLIRTGKEFVIRIPLIPGINDTKENMLAVANQINGASGLQRVELLRYHKTAGAKYKMVGQEYNPPFDTEKPPHVYNVFKDYNIETLLV